MNYWSYIVIALLNVLVIVVMIGTAVNAWRHVTRKPIVETAETSVEKVVTEPFSGHSNVLIEGCHTHMIWTDNRSLAVQCCDPCCGPDKLIRMESAEERTEQ